MLRFWQKSLALVGILVFLCSTGGRAEGFWDGNKLFAECGKATKACDAWLAGLADMAPKEAGVALPRECLRIVDRQDYAGVFVLKQKIRNGAHMSAWPQPQ